MNIIKQSAACLDRTFRELIKPQSYEDYLNVVDTKTDLLNLSTTAAVASLVLGIFGVLSALAALVLAGCFFFVRTVAEESYNVKVPFFNIPTPDWVKQLFPNVFKPDPSLTIGNWVIFYEHIPRCGLLTF